MLSILQIEFFSAVATSRKEEMEKVISLKGKEEVDVDGEVNYY